MTDYKLKIQFSQDEVDLYDEETEFISNTENICESMCKNLEKHFTILKSIINKL